MGVTQNPIQLFSLAMTHRNCGMQLKTPQGTSSYKSSIPTGPPPAQVTGRPPIKLRTLKAPIAITLEVFLEPINALTPRSLLRAGLRGSEITLQVSSTGNITVSSQVGSGALLLKHLGLPYRTDWVCELRSRRKDPSSERDAAISSHDSQWQDRATWVPEISSLQNLWLQAALSSRWE